MTKIGKDVLIAYTALLVIFVQSGCVGAVNPETGEKTWKFAPSEAVKSAVATVKELPDEAKASIFEGLGWLLGSFGVGAAAVPFCSTAANYYRNRGKKTVAAKTDAKAEAVSTEGEQKEAV